MERPNPGLLPLLSVAGATIYLYLMLFRFPTTPTLLGGDQVYFWTDAGRMLHDGRIYQDFLQFTPPGTDLLFLGLFKVFGFRVWATNLIVLGLGMAFCCLCFDLASGIMRRSSALLTTAFFAVAIYGRTLNATHHWFSALAAMGAVKALQARVSALRLSIAGGLLGVASFFTQTHAAAAVVAFVAFLSIRELRVKEGWAPLAWKLMYLLCGLALVVLLLNAPYLFSPGVRQLWYFQVTYIQEYVAHAFPSSTILGLPGALTWHSLPRMSQYLVIYLLLPTIYLFAFWRCWKERHNLLFPWDRIALLSVSGFFLLVEVAVHLSWLRLYSVSLAGIVLGGWAWDSLAKMRRYGGALLWVFLVGAAGRQIVINRKYQSVIASFPGGRVATSPETYERLNWVREHTRPGDFFFQAGWPEMYLPLQLRSAVFVDTVLPAESGGSGTIDDAVADLNEKQVKLVVWTAELDTICNQNAPSRDHIAPLRRYLDQRYLAVKVFSNGDVAWLRKHQ
jgi:hypothetical protein